MNKKAMILPLDIEGKIYTLQDESGKAIGTGTRETCEVLLSIINTPSTPPVSVRCYTIGSCSGTTMLVPQRRQERVR